MGERLTGESDAILLGAVWTGSTVDGRTGVRDSGRCRPDSLAKCLGHSSGADAAAAGQASSAPRRDALAPDKRAATDPAYPSVVRESDGARSEEHTSELQSLM